VLPVFELGYGRGLAMFGATIAIVAFFFPLLTRLGEGTRSPTAPRRWR
jgi:hypothetical protein